MIPALRDNQNPLFGARKPVTPAPVLPTPQPKEKDPSDYEILTRGLASINHQLKAITVATTTKGAFGALGCLMIMNVILVVVSHFVNLPLIVSGVYFLMACLFITYSAGFAEELIGKANKTAAKIVFASVVVSLLMIVSVLYAAGQTLDVQRSKNTEMLTASAKVLEQDCPGQGDKFKKQYKTSSMETISKAFIKISQQCK